VDRAGEAELVPTKFGISINQWTNKVKGEADTACRRIVYEMFSRIIYRSPVDTGLFRGNWVATVGSIPVEKLEVYDKDASIAMARLEEASDAFKAGVRIYLTNNLEYARRLEYGWSKQAPNGMVRVTLSEFQSVVGAGR
jgi:hypothetical protein